jgi:fatty-acyl-CoA synthase
LILVSVNPSFLAEELSYCLNKVGCRALIMADHHKKFNFIETVKKAIPELNQAASG